MKAVALLPLLWLAMTTAAGEPAIDDPQLSAAEKGRAIALAAERRRSGFGDSVTDATMTLIGADGRERRRRLTWRTLEGTAPGVGDKSLTLFHEPRDIAGTAFLSHTYVERADDQWLYLPSLRRVRRIAAPNQSSAFVGSEFTYEDLLSDEVERFDYRWLRDEPCAETTCFVVERRPRYAHSGYSKQEVWLDQDELRPMRIAFYDQRERHQKTLMLADYAVYLDRFWRAHRLSMENHLTGRHTELTFAPFALRTGLHERDFDPGMLQRLR